MHEGQEGDVELIDLLEDEERGYEAAENRELLASGLHSLDERERRILQLRFVDGLTQSQIAADIGVSQMHVSRLPCARRWRSSNRRSTAMRAPGRLHAGEPGTVELKVPPRPENLALARLALTGVGTIASASEGAIADLKLAITEACTNSILHGYPNGTSGELVVRLRSAGEAIEVEVEDSGVRIRPVGEHRPATGRRSGHGPDDHPVADGLDRDRERRDGQPDLVCEAARAG